MTTMHLSLRGILPVARVIQKAGPRRMCSSAVPRRRGQGGMRDVAEEKSSRASSWKMPVASNMWPPYTSTGMDSITLVSSQHRNATLERVQALVSGVRGGGASSLPAGEVGVGP